MQYINKMEAVSRERPIPKIPRFPSREPKGEEIDKEIKDLFKYSVLLIVMILIVMIALRVLRVV